MRERFLVLDGLRGIVAFGIFWSHLYIFPFGWMVQTQLAVDFFFVLSGFVLTHAYGDRLGHPGAVMRFLRNRVIRMHPLLLLSIVPGAVALLANAPRRDPFPLLTVLAACIPIPAVWRMGQPEFPFPLNMPSWSLFWGLAANLLFALLAPRLSTRALILGTVLLVAAQVLAPWFSIEPNSSDASAMLRAFPCFAAGVLLHRLHRQGLAIPGWIGALAAPLLILTLVTQQQPGAALYIPVIVLGLYPLIIAGGAAREARFPRLCAFLGGMSYPLYILHMPLLSILRAIFGRAEGAMVVIQPLLCLAIVWAIWRLYDEPLRAWLQPRSASAERANDA